MTLQVQIGDVIRNGTGDYSETVLIAWAGDSLDDVRAICLVPPRGDGQFLGTFMQRHFMTYNGWLRPTEEEERAADEANDDYAAREGHTWTVNIEGYEHVREPWWEVFRATS